MPDIIPFGPERSGVAQLTEIASGLEFPEGPVVMDDGSIVLVEIAAARVTRVTPDGATETVAEPGGGPNGAAIGPDGRLYVCNNGGAFHYEDMGGILFPHQPSPGYEGSGRIERVDLDSGEVDVLYTECDGRPLRAPNDLVFDGHGGFYFTDYGYRDERVADRTGVLYALADGSSISEVAHPLDAPNGVGLSPDGSRLYVAETLSGRVWWWDVEAPGRLAHVPGVLPHGAQLLAGLPELQGLDSLAIDSEGHVCVATLVSGGITRISPDGGRRELFGCGDLLTTNIAFGGEDLRTAYVTLSGTGRLGSMPWPVPGLPLAHTA
jgi:gluconolactonase